MKVNKYFDDNVFSIGFDSKDGAVSSGVMAPGEYTFGTSQKEKMVVVHGTMTVKLPGKDTWEEIVQGNAFDVEACVEFNVKIEEHCAYLCYYS